MNHMKVSCVKRPFPPVKCRLGCGEEFHGGLHRMLQVGRPLLQPPPSQTSCGGNRRRFWCNQPHDTPLPDLPLPRGLRDIVVSGGVCLTTFALQGYSCSRNHFQWTLYTLIKFRRRCYSLCKSTATEIVIGRQSYDRRKHHENRKICLTTTVHEHFFLRLYPFVLPFCTFLWFVRQRKGRGGGQCAYPPSQPTKRHA